ncbi:MAG: glycosyltransferase [Candidatus Electrothrix scaldis]|nr:MAG: glycosyltransferase [Candidatus Electrothrix sp. GW3-3]
MSKCIQFSVVIPVHNEEKNISPLLLEIQRAMGKSDDFEVIIADDHSSDRSYDILQEHTKRFSWLKIVRLKHQSGQSAALRH